MTTKITPSVLENTTVAPSTYGTASQVSTLTVDAQGRVTGASNTSISIDTSQVTSGTLADARLPNQGSLTAANYYGNANNLVQISVDAKGRIKSATNVAIQIATSQITGYPTFASSATTDTTNANNITTGTLPLARLPGSGVTLGSYGSASSVPAITVDAYGRITSVTATTIAISSGAVSGLAASATTDTSNATNITTGTLATARLADSGVGATTYGTASNVSRFTVDAKGRVTAASNVAIGIAAGAVSGLATVATSGSYNDLTNKPSIPSGQVNSDWNATSGISQILNKPSLATVATSGSYTDLSNKPSIPTSVSQLTPITPDVQTFNSTGTWTKPTGGQTMARIMVWGGGAGGSYDSGGNGGAYNEQVVPLSWLSSAVTAVVGAGGGGSAGLGGNGGTSSFTLANNGISGKTSVAAGGGYASGQAPIGPYLWSSNSGYAGGQGAGQYDQLGVTTPWGGTGGVGAYYNGGYTPGSGQQPGGGGAAANGTVPGGNGAAGRIIVMCW